MKDVLLSPAEWLVVIVSFEKPGTAALRTLDYDRGWMGPGRPKDAGIIADDQGVADACGGGPALPAILRQIADPGAPVVSRRFAFGESMGMGAGGMQMDFTINGAPFDMNRVDVVSKVGQIELWEITNPTDMDHPFHLHGTQFRLLGARRQDRKTRL